MPFTRTLNITCGDVGGEPVTLLLCFQVPDPEQLYTKQFPVAWRVIEFAGTGIEDASSTYVSQLFVSNPQVLDGNRVTPNIWIEIEPGQTTALKPNGSEFTFSAPVGSNGPIIIATNKTGTTKDFGIGFVKDRKPVPLLQFPAIKNNYSLAAEFTPILQAFVVSGYQETDILRGAIETRDPIWVRDIRAFRDESDWIFNREPVSGKYQIVGN